jgi:hypothetical protein
MKGIGDVYHTKQYIKAQAVCRNLLLFPAGMLPEGGGVLSGCNLSPLKSKFKNHPFL